MDNFKLERYFAKYEFKVKYLLSPSDCEALGMQELLDEADPSSRRMWDELTLSYTESQGHPSLRREISHLYSGISPEQLLIAVPEEAIFIAMHTLLKPGDHVVALFPAYQSLYEVARSTGCQVSFWEIRLSEEGWHLDLEELKQAVRPETRLLVINFPHNPTGFNPSLTELQAILDIAREHNLVVFSDEMYRLLEYDPADRLPAVVDIYSRGVSLSGLSKTFALPGLRIGWLAANDPALIDSWLAFKDYTTICSSAPSEVLGIMALRQKEEIISRNIGILSENRRVARDLFESHPDLFTWLEPDAGSVAFPAWLGPGSVDEFCQRILDLQGVMIVPGSIFDYPGQHFRVGLGRKNFSEALAQLKDYLSNV
jgi:aspartate/methionine/tyrosine aminotransferase